MSGAGDAAAGAGRARDAVTAGARGVLGAASALAGVALLAVVVATPLDLRTQAVFAAIVFGAALWIGGTQWTAGRLVLMLVSIAVSLRYLAWRVTATVQGGLALDALLSAVLLAAEVYAIAMLALGYLQAAWPLPRAPVPLPDDPARWPSVDVFIPTYDEPLEVVRATVLAARAMDWPAGKLQIYLLDDGRRAAFRELAARAGVGYVTRQDNAHAKAGNLNHALQRARGEFVAVFDCDHVPTRAFLQLTMGWMARDPGIAVVQTPHHFYSADPFERNLSARGDIPNESQLFYGLIQPGNDLWNAAFFCGSAAVLRRSALDQIGGFAVETVTEDAHTALRLHRRGWRSAYLDVPLSAGLATETLSAHVGQRIRWARGMAQIFRIENPLLARGLGLWQRLCYAAAMLHFFSALPRLVYLFTPALYLLFDRHVFASAPLMAIAYALPHLSHVVVTSSRVEGAYRRTFWSEVYDAVLAPYTLVPTLLAMVDPRRGAFGVTGKGGVVEEDFFDRGIARPGLALAALNLACLGAGAWKLWSGHLEADAIAINMFWAGHNLFILLAGLAAAHERQQTRESPRVAVRLAAALQTEDERALPCETVDLARQGARVRLGPTSRDFREGERVWLAMTVNGEELPLPASVVSHDEGGLRVRFAALGLEEESHLVQAMFSRADAWREWRERRPSNPLRSLVEVAVFGARGVLRALVPAAARPVGSTDRSYGSAARQARRLLALALATSAALAGTASARDLATAARPEDDTRTTRVARELALTDEQRATVARELQLPFVVRSDRALGEALAEIGFDSTQRIAGGLEVLVNRQRVAFFDADRLARDRLVQQVEIPRRVLSDRNLLTLRLVVPGEADCAVPRGSWRFVRSVRLVQLSHPQPLPNDLALLPLPFVDRESDAEATIPIVLPPDPSAARIRAASLVASWFGVNNGVPLRFPVHLGELPPSRAVVLLDGPQAATALGLPPMGRGLRMMDHPRFPGSNVKLLVVSGRDLPDLDAVAQALASGTMPLAGAAVDAPAPPRLPTSLPWDAPRFVPSGRLVPLGKFPGVESLAFEGAATGSVTVRFRIAPDLWLWPREHVELDLGYSVAAEGDAGPPRLDVAVNGRHVGTLPPLAAGEKAGRATLLVPRELLRGYNELKLHVRFADAEGRCDGGAAGRVALAPDSALHVEMLPHFARVPDVSLFVYDGFPFTRVADLSETAVVLPERPRPEEIATALSIVAQLGAITGRTATGVSFATPATLGGGHDLDKDLLLVGVAQDHALVRRWADRLPLAVGSGASRARLPSIAGLLALLNPVFAWEELHRAGPVLARARELAAVVAFDSPLGGDRSAVLVTATTASRMPAFADLLGDAESRSRVNDVLVLTEEGHALFRIGPSHGSGDIDLLTRVRWSFSNDWLLLVPALFGGAALVAWPARRSLADRARRRLSPGEDRGP